MSNYNTSFRIQTLVLETLQEVTEAFLVNKFKSKYNYLLP